MCAPASSDWNNDVRSMPVVPPMPWHANTSSVSSATLVMYADMSSCVSADTAAPIIPMRAAAPTLTKPAAGVMATRPTTTPRHMPVALNVCPLTCSSSIQVSIATAVATLVLRIACEVYTVALSAEPPTKPNQPNHSRAVPSTTYGTLAGSSVLTFDGPRKKAAASAA
eukprot:362344-Chlamydomonas_euryale.AAC.5